MRRSLKEDSPKISPSVSLNLRNLSRASKAKPDKLLLQCARDSSQSCLPTPGGPTTEMIETNDEIRSEVPNK
jgi:hypothetical protein